MGLIVESITDILLHLLLNSICSLDTFKDGIQLQGVTLQQDVSSGHESSKWYGAKHLSHARAGSTHLTLPAMRGGS